MPTVRSPRSATSRPRVLSGHSPPLVLLHLPVDHLQRLRRHADFAPERSVENRDDVDHGRGEERDESAKQEMGADPEIEQAPSATVYHMTWGMPEETL
jgi:hypothetical protein